MTTRPLAGAIAWTLGVLLIATIVHIASILLMPALAARDAYAQLTSVPAGSGFHTLPSDAQDGSWPFTDPGVVLAVCRFDLGSRPLRIRVDTDRDALTTVSFHARNGIVFHTLTDRAALRGRIDVILGTAAQIDLIEAADNDEAPVQDVRLTAPSRQGFVLLRGLASSRSRTEALRRHLSQAECSGTES